MAINFTAQTPSCVRKKHLLFVLNLFLATFIDFDLLGLVCSTSTYHGVSEEMLPSLRLTIPMTTSPTVYLLNNLMAYFSVGFCGFSLTGLLTPYGLLFKPPLEAKFLKEFYLLNFAKTLLSTLDFPR